MKVLSSLCLVSVLLLMGCNNNTRSSSTWNNLGDTCYAKDANKRSEADALFNRFRRLLQRMKESEGDREAAVRHASAAWDALEASARIGNPMAFLTKCVLAVNNKGSFALRLDSMAWCKVGIDTIPDLSVKLGSVINRGIVEYASEPEFHQKVRAISSQICR